MRVCRVLLALTFGLWPFAAGRAQGTDRAALIAYVDSATSLMQRYSIRRDQVNWPSLRSAARAVIETAARPDSTTAWMAVRVAIAHLGDHHTHLRDPATVRRFRSGDPSIAPSNPDPEVRLLTGAMGYVRIPRYEGSDAGLTDRYAVSLRNRIGAIAEQARCGWVVDLRGNTGGNMWPMLNGIGPVLGDGMAGRFITLDTMVPWGYGEGSAWSGSPRGLEGAALTTRAPSPWVAVLTDRSTGSSGEIITIAFRGRPVPARSVRPRRE